MFNCIAYLNFYLKAKGRHGTHSPFAYWLVDVVARAKMKSTHFRDSLAINKKTTHFIQKLAHALPDFRLEQFNRINSEKSKITYLLEPHILFLSEENFIFFKSWYSNIDFHPQTLVILSGHRTSKINKNIWNELCGASTFHFSADCFHFGILSPKPGQAKQHFYLKLS